MNKNTVNVFWQILYFYNLPSTKPPPPSHDYYHHQDGGEDLAHILLRCMPAAKPRNLTCVFTEVSLVIDLQVRSDMSTIDCSIVYSVLDSLVTCSVPCCASPCDGLTAALTIYSHPVCRHSHKHLTHHPIIVYTQPNY